MLSFYLLRNIFFVLRYDDITWKIIFDLQDVAQNQNENWCKSRLKGEKKTDKLAANSSKK